MSENKSEGEAILDLLGAVVRSLEPLPLEDLLQTVEQYQTTAPLLDPTAYRNGGAQNLADQAELLRAAQAFRDTGRAIIMRLEADEDGQERDLFRTTP